ncbi:MAG: protein-glutamate O-methyltransferase CheR [Pontiellaceae bacterium]|nr:protein-glutamate O-methyltransferase CheR [Pontiellaceae bacterium]
MQLPDSDIDRLLNTIKAVYGHDFTEYAQASLKRRILRFMQHHEFQDANQVIAALTTDPALLHRFVYDLSVVVTEMFRDPWVYQTLRIKVIPWLKTFPFIRIWHAGCATGEEVYAMAVLLQEEDLTQRTQIYATDLNDEALKKAREGIYSLSRIKEFTRNYHKSGGKESFSDYYHAKYDAAIMAPELRHNITFANHNLATDTVFGEMQLILCRNVLIYFTRPLQNRVLHLFSESLCSGGILCLGTKESIRFSPAHRYFEAIVPEENIFKRTVYAPRALHRMEMPYE